MKFLKGVKDLTKYLLRNINLNTSVMKNFTSILLFVFIGLTAKATTFMVAVSNFQFSPSDIPNVMVGDIIQFNFGGSNNHNAVSNPLGLVPAGAAPIASGNPGAVTTSYSYTVTVPGSYRYYCTVHSFDGLTGMAGTFTASGVLPVTLKNFNASVISGHVFSQWQTTSEQNISYFSVQKSYDGKQYQEAGRVNATGNSSSLRSYNYTDQSADLTARYIYYLLKTVDIDGRNTFSETKLVRNDKAPQKLIISMSPNPVNRSIGHLMLQFNSDKVSKMKAVVKDAAGKTVMDLDLSAVRGINNGHIHMGSLPPGMYSILFSMDGIRETQTVIVE